MTVIVIAVLASVLQMSVLIDHQLRRRMELMIRRATDPLWHTICFNIANIDNHCGDHLRYLKFLIISRRFPTISRLPRGSRF